MNREILKKAYIEQKECDDNKRKDMEVNYEAHHIAMLHPDLIDNQENCILLINDEVGKELLEYPEYNNWLSQQEGYDKLDQERDIKVVKAVLKPIKKKLKSMFKSKSVETILDSIRQGG